MLENEILLLLKNISPRINNYLQEKKILMYISQVFFDSTLNNKDQLGFEIITEKALEKIKYNGKQNVIFPSLYGNSLDYTLLAMFGRGR